jgi:hypothetical protein
MKTVKIKVHNWHLYVILQICIIVPLVIIFKYYEKKDQEKEAIKKESFTDRFRKFVNPKYRWGRDKYYGVLSYYGIS